VDIFVVLSDTQLSSHLYTITKYTYCKIFDQLCTYIKILVAA